MKYFQLKRRKLTSTNKKENEQFLSIEKEYLGNDMSFDFIEVPDLFNLLEKEDDNDIKESSILALVPEANIGDWVHLRLTDYEWRKLDLPSSLKGQSRNINGVKITYGRWSESNDNRADNIKEEFNKKIYAHVLGMFHEKYHTSESIIAVVHSFLYGYDRLYTKAEERLLKPKRNYENMSLLKLFEYFKNKEEPIIPVVTPQIVDTSSYDSLIEFKKHFVLTEVVPKSIHDSQGDLAWRMFPNELLDIIVWIRRGIGKPIRINNYVMNLQFRGYDNGYRASTSISWHKLARAFDFDVIGMSSIDVRQWIRDNIDTAPHKNFRMERLRNGVEIGWNHIDVPYNQKGLTEFND